MNRVCDVAHRLQFRRKLAEIPACRLRNHHAPFLLREAEDTLVRRSRFRCSPQSPAEVCARGICRANVHYIARDPICI